jgi:hypothetical protein
LNIPSNPYARGEIVVIAVIGRRDPVANLHKPLRGVRIEDANLVVFLFDHCCAFISEAEVDGDPRGHTVVIL